MSTRSFTEAVPLSLSSMAHMSHPLEDGVLDGLRQVLQHTLLQCVNYARMVHRTQEWTMYDLTTSKYAWTPCKGEAPPSDLPWSLSRLGFKHQYPRHTWLYFKPLLADQEISLEEELSYLKNGWEDKLHVLGRVSLLYASQELLTKEELDGTEMDDGEDVPPLVLYKILVEYRSLPATGSQQAVQAEELSMLSFGGSVDDDVKLGALASLYDEVAKYVLEIYSVRGKKYKFDLMDSTLSDGTVPRLPSASNQDPFARSLCVTVTEYSPEELQSKPPEEEEEEDNKNDNDNENANEYNEGEGGGDDNKNNNTDKDEDEKMEEEETKADAGAVESKEKSDDAKEAPATSKEKKKTAITRMNLLLDGNLRKGKNSYDHLPKFDFIVNEIKASFLLLHSPAPAMATATPSGQTLLLDPALAGRLYINGRYVTTWGKDTRLGSHFPALFGMDLHSVAFWHGRVMDFDTLKVIYAQLLQEILVDARLSLLDIGKKLLYRLMYGKDPEPDDDDDAFDDDDEDEENIQESAEPPDTSVDCLESLVMQSKRFDPVGISAKALATRFTTEFGLNAFPCLKHEVEWVKEQLPERKPVVVPQRLLNVVRRGGFFSVKMTSDECWFAETRPPNEGSETELVEAAIKNLEEAGCKDIKPAHIVFVPGNDVADCIKKKAVCRYNETLCQYHISEKFLTANLKEILNQGELSTATNGDGDDIKIRALIMGVYIAQQHPDGSVLVRYILRNSQQGWFLLVC